MNKVFFLVNQISDFDFAGLVDRHLSDCAVSAGTEMPPDAEEYDLVILWNYRKKVPVNDGRKRNVILFHSAPLPAGRGWAPIYNTIAQGLEHYTVSCIFAADRIDEGDLIAQARFRVMENHVAADLRRWDTEISLMLAGMILKRTRGGVLQGKKQEGVASWWPRRKPEDNRIDITQPFAALIPHLRACEEQHPAFFVLGETKYLVQVTAESKPDFPADMEIEFFDAAREEK